MTDNAVPCISKADRAFAREKVKDAGVVTSTCEERESVLPLPWYLLSQCLDEIDRLEAAASTPPASYWLRQ
jgi:hypothetical protein